MENALDAGKDMFGGVSDLLDWRSGGAPEMLSAKGSVTRDPKKMAEMLKTAYIKKLDEVDEKLGAPTWQLLVSDQKHDKRKGAKIPLQTGYRRQSKKEDKDAGEY